MVRRKRRDKVRSTASETTDDIQKSIMKSTVDVIRLPKGAVRKINIGQSFAEYDISLNDRNVYVYTPALSFAEDPDSGKVFFVGRRGTGKTAIRRYCAQDEKRFQAIVPEIFSPSSVFQELEQFSNVKQRPFKSLVSAFRRALQIELLNLWKSGHPTYYGTPTVIDEELEQFGSLDFDERCLCFIRRISEALTARDDDRWLKENKAVKGVAEGMKSLGMSGLKTHTLLIDSIDDYWEGTDEGLVYLTAFMHACLETTAQIPWARTILFLRENIFERVRAKDPESSRLETAVIGMDWTESQLLELVERRLNNSLTAKLPLGGPTWEAYFESPEIAWNSVMEFCQRRPRDVLIYISHAVEAAQNNGHERIQLGDIEQARRRFSDNRFKDLGDEYAENYPQIALVLARFYGLGNSFTFGGIESLTRKLLNDLDVIRHCSSWLYDNCAPERFIRLLYSIGFVGFRAAEGAIKFRALGPQETSPPPLLDTTDIVIHKCYWDALDLQDRLVRDLPETKAFGKIGKIEDLPGGMDVSEYTDALDLALGVLREIPPGPEGATDFEEVVGDVIKLCFFRGLENVEERVKDYEGRVIRDWIAANRARDGFWAMVRERYGAVQVIWECKNYADLSADDFHQLSYYMTDIGGRFVVLAYRGDLKPFHFQHIRRIANNNNGFILPLSEKDLMIFLRQAMNGKIKEDHIQDRFDAVLRKIT